MSPLLIDYYQRFAAGIESVKFDYFFTQLSPTEAFAKLPYLFQIESFCLRLLKAFLHQEKICIYSDYDTDAVTAAAVAYWGLTKLGFPPHKLSFYAPDRFTEGYGLNLLAIQKLASDHDLILTVDCGINSTQEAAFLRTTKTDLLITDHHHLHGPLPEATAVVNPRLAEFYPNNPDKLVDYQQFLSILSKQLEDSQLATFSYTLATQVFQTRQTQSRNFLSQAVTGVGVIWFSLVWLAYFLQVLKQEFSHLPWPTPRLAKLNTLLALVAIGTIADCQSVLDPENRLLVRSGLQILQQKKYPFPGLHSLMEHSGLQTKLTQGYKLTSQDLSFILSPILNSSGRISHARLSIDTLTAKDPSQADLLARELVATNENRKHLVKTITDEVQLLVKQQLSQNQPVLWLEGQWNKGIIGLLASRLVTQFNLPCVVVSRQADEVVASLRAPKGFHLVQAIKRAENWLVKFGGHPEAAGFTCKLTALPSVKSLIIQSLIEQAQVRSEPTTKFTPTNFNIPPILEPLSYEPQYIWLQPQDLDSELFQQTWLLDPFGQDFPIPKFVFPLALTSPKWFGERNQHLKIHLHPDISLTWFNVDESIKFQLGSTAQPIWLATRLTQNPWNGRLRHDLIVDQFWLT